MRTGCRVLIWLTVVTVLAGCGLPPLAPPPPIVVPPDPAAPPPPPAEPHPTVWDVLGVSQLVHCVGQIIEHKRNHLGLLCPHLEAVPPIRAITDPANLLSPIPAVAAAAEVKAAEDAAPQKIKALRYLATIGCGGCYPEVEDALLAALDDCTEAVRFEAAQAIFYASGNPCVFCRADACCSTKVLNKLNDIAFGMDERHCPKEPSARVRRSARLGLRACGGLVTPAAEDLVEPLPLEGPPLELVPPEELPPPSHLLDPPSPSPPVAPPPPVAEGEWPALLQSTPGLDGWEFAEDGFAEEYEVLSPGEEFPFPSLSPPGSIDLPEAIPVERRQRSGLRFPEHDPAAAPSADKPRRLDEQVRRKAAPLLPEPDRLLATVNDEPIYGRDLAAALEGQLSQLAPSRASDADVRRSIFERELQRAIDRKLLSQEARRHQPASEILAVAFQELDEHDLAERWFRQAIPTDGTVTPQEVKAWYHANLTAWQRPAEVRWELIAAPLDRFASRDKARTALTQVRSRAVGDETAAPPAEAARSIRIETRGWTRQDQIRPPAVAAALSELPVGQVSPVLEDESAFYLVRVLERRPERRVSLQEAAPTIRDEILRRRQLEAGNAYLQKLHRSAQVWSILDVSP